MGTLSELQNREQTLKTEIEQVKKGQRALSNKKEEPLSHQKAQAMKKLRKAIKALDDHLTTKSQEKKKTQDVPDKSWSEKETGLQSKVERYRTRLDALNERIQNEHTMLPSTHAQLKKRGNDSKMESEDQYPELKPYGEVRKGESKEGKSFHFAISDKALKKTEESEKFTKDLKPSELDEDHLKPDQTGQRIFSSIHLITHGNNEQEESKKFVIFDKFKSNHPEHRKFHKIVSARKTRAVSDEVFDIATTSYAAYYKAQDKYREEVEGKGTTDKLVAGITKNPQVVESTTTTQSPSSSPARSRSNSPTPPR